MDKDTQNQGICQRMPVFFIPIGTIYVSKKRGIHPEMRCKSKECEINPSLPKRATMQASIEGSKNCFSLLKLG